MELTRSTRLGSASDRLIENHRDQFSLCAGRRFFVAGERGAMDYGLGIERGGEWDLSTVSKSLICVSHRTWPSKIGRP
jgi:hypothetical protein